MGPGPFVQFGRRHHVEQLCKIILNWTSVSGENAIYRHFLSGALAALFFRGAEPIVQFW